MSDPGKRKRPAANQALSKVTHDTTATDPSVPERLDRFLHDTLLDAFLAAERQWWLRRAEDFDRAKPDPDRDYCGKATPEELRDQWRRLDELAKACRARAHVSPVDHIREDVETVLREVA